MAEFNCDASFECLSPVDSSTPIDNKPENVKGKPAEFFTNWKKGTSGIVKHGNEVAKNSFAMELSALVEADECTGYMARVVRELDLAERDCFFTSDSISLKWKFMNQVNASYGCGGMTSALESTALIEYFQYLQRSFTGKLPIKTGVLVPGNRSDGTCILNENTFISSDGTLMDPSDSNLVWLNRDIVHDSSKVRASDVTPMILHPLSAEPLHELYTICEKVSKHNLIPTLIMIAGTMQCFHFKTLLENYGCCPIPIAIGDSETGKSTALQAGLSLFGYEEIGVCVKGSNAILLERACSSGIPFAIEEGKGGRSKSKTNQFDVAELIIDLANGSRSSNMRTGTMKPQTVPIIASNFMLEAIDRVQSRVLLVPFSLPTTGPLSEAEFDAYDDLKQSFESGKFSSAVGWVVKQRQEFLESGKEYVRSMQQKIRGPVTSRVRNSTGWASCLFFLNQFLSFVGKKKLMEEAQEFIVASVNGSTSDTSVQRKQMSPQEIVISCCKELIAAAQNLPINKILQFMRTGTEVQGREVLMVWVKGAGPYLTITGTAFTRAVRLSGIGTTQEKRNFLSEDSDDVVINESNSTRRSGNAIFLDEPLSEEMIKELRVLTKQTKKPRTPILLDSDEEVESAESAATVEHKDDPPPHAATTSTNTRKSSKNSKKPKTPFLFESDEEVESAESAATVEHKDDPPPHTETSRKRKTPDDIHTRDDKKALKIDAPKYSTRSRVTVPPFSKALCRGESLFPSDD